MRYFLIQFLRKPNGQIDEQVFMSRKVRPSDLSTCNVIMDFADKSILKCIIEGKKLDTSWDSMYTYYKKVYPGLFAQLEQQVKLNEQIEEE